MQRAEIHIHDLIENKARTDAGFAIAYALLKLADEQKSIATHLRYFVSGTNHVKGEFELSTMFIGEKLDALTAAISEHA